MSNRVKKIVVFVFVALFCGVIALVVLLSEPRSAEAAEGKQVTIAAMPVSVQTLTPGPHAARVRALGEVAPLWQTTLRSQVDGRIVYLSDRLQPGVTVRRGEVLLRLEQSGYQVAVAEAQSRLASAMIALLAEEREVREAKKNWQRSGLTGEPASPLVLRGPQLAAAEADVEAAEAALAHTQTQLGYTEIAAPYDGVILERNVNPAQSLFTGDPVATLQSLDHAEVAIRLDATAWDLLPIPLEDAPARLVDPEKGTAWPATVRRESRALDRESRLRTLYLVVDRPLDMKPPLLPGSFVRAEIEGKHLDDLLRIPENALTKQGLAWYVDSEDRLRSWRAEPLFYGEGVVFVAPPLPGTPVVLALSPHSGFTNSLQVRVLDTTEEP
ncbi:MAG: efflux RND transporter periplasmic adaptor subunit [Acidobacteriota bacterium]|nr:efflux RND transporter periplasmic adaptor subunit [Acidobacteriota bacterium]